LSIILYFTVKEEGMPLGKYDLYNIKGEYIYN